jgi:methyl-accepting chemotaxis protein
MQQAARVEHGVDRAHQAQTSIREIASGAAHVVGGVGDITSALREPGVASQDLASNVESVAQMAEENSAAAQAAADTAQTLKHLAGVTLDAVAAFRQGNEHAS